MSVSRSCLGNNLQWKSHNRDFTGTHIAYYNPFAPESPGNLPCGSTSLLPLLTSPVLIYTLTCAEWRDVSNDTRLSTIQSRTPEEKAKNHVMLTRKLAWKSCSTTHLPFLSSNPKILTAFLKTFSTKMKPTGIMPNKSQKMRQEKQKKREERKRKVKVKTSVSLLNPKTILKFCFLRMPQLHKLIWIRGSLSVRPVNRKLCGKFLLLIARQWPEKRSASFKTRFSPKSPALRTAMNKRYINSITIIIMIN